VFEMVWIRTATLHLHDDLPGGMVLCSPTRCKHHSKNKTIALRDEQNTRFVSLQKLCKDVNYISDHY
jgi:hypothetical protein